MQEDLVEAAVARGIPQDYARANPHDAFMRSLLGKSIPTRNDCGYPSRFEYEDNCRLGGWGEEGVGLCDYPQSCPVYKEGKCPLK